MNLYLFVMPKTQHVKFVLTLNLVIDPHGETDEAIRKELEGLLKPCFAARKPFPGISGRGRRILDQLLKGTRKELRRPIAKRDQENRSRFARLTRESQHSLPRR